MKKILFALMIVFCMKSALAADPAIEYMRALSEDVITNGLQKTTNVAEREAFMRERFTKNLDLKSIGQFVLGTYWKKADKDQKQAFLDVFTELLTKTWTDRFGLYNGQTIQFTSVEPAQQKGQLYVNSEIQDKTPISLRWRVRPKDGKYLVIDIVIENVSMAISYRSEYTAFLQQHQGNLNDLIDELKKKVSTFKYGAKK